jgi:hypothetical protein
VVELHTVQLREHTAPHVHIAYALISSMIFMIPSRIRLSHQ